MLRPVSIKRDFYLQCKRLYHILQTHELVITEQEKKQIFYLMVYKPLPFYAYNFIAVSEIEILIVYSVCNSLLDISIL